MNGYANSKFSLNNGKSRTDNPMEGNRTKSTLTNELKAYLAGIFDGEGSIHINKTSSPHCLKLWQRISPNYSLNCGVTNSHFGILELFKNNFGGGIYDRKAHRVYDYRIDKIIAKNMLEILLPYLIIKKEQAKIAVEFQNSMTITGKKVNENQLQFREKCRNKIKNLNGSNYHKQRLKERTTQEVETIVRHS